MPQVTLLAALPHKRYTQNDDTIAFCFPIHFQFAFKPPLKVVSLNPHSIRIGSMRIPCGRNQCESIRIQCALFLSCRQALSVYLNTLLVFEYLCNRANIRVNQVFVSALATSATGSLVTALTVPN